MSWAEQVDAAYGTTSVAGFGPLTVDVEPARWVEGLGAARDALGCAFFDFLTAVDAVDAGFDVVAHVARLETGEARSLLIRTRVPRDMPVVGCACGVYAGAGWHERETHEMFGIGFAGHDPLNPLLLPEGFEGHPLRKEFVLVSRVVKPWPGAKEPGESDEDEPGTRRRTPPPGVPEPGRWPRAGD